MGKLLRNAKSFAGGLVSLAIALIVLFFILNWISQRGWGPLSTFASWTEGRATGQAYGGGGGATVGVPSSGSSYGPML